MYYKCKFMFITSIINENKKIYIELNKKFRFAISDTGAKLRCGRTCIAYLNTKHELKNLYLLDSDNKPYQVMGDFDVLLDGAVIYDETKELIKNNAYAVQFCIQAFNALNKNQIELNKNILLDIENKLFDYILNSQIGFKALKKNASDILKDIYIDENIKNIIINSINISPMPRAALDKKLEIDIDEYPLSKIVRW